jgi:ABC-type multidrug transport system ATPase subunit
VNNPAGSTYPAPVVVQDLGVVFGNQVALRGVTFKVGWGERILVRGHNGAGKSTLIRALAGLVQPDRGSVAIAGRSPYDRDVRRRIGVVVHNPWLDPDLTVQETLKYFSTLYGIPESTNQLKSLLARFGMADRGDQRVGELSRGYQQRLTLARALLHNPGILLLDEPDTGLDDETLDALASLLGDHRTIVMTSHNKGFGELIANRVLTLEHGSLIAFRDVERTWARTKTP